MVTVQLFHLPSKLEEAYSTFKEGNHTLKVTATGLNNLTTTAQVSLTVSFNAPENLQVTIENDTAV